MGMIRFEVTLAFQDDG